MIKEELLAELRLATENPRIQLPSNMDFQVIDGILKIKLSSDGIIGNMQDDASAFEGWTLCLKAWLPTIIQRIEIEWPVGRESQDWSRGERLHYGRFLYRVWKFTRTFDWSVCGYPRFFSSYGTDGYVVNIPQQEANNSAENEEAQIEREYVKAHRNGYDGLMNHQLPVGIFKNNVVADCAIMPTGNSQIDIWAIKEDELSIFELKKESNAKIGIISELMFYCNIMDDLMSHRIHYPDNARNCKYRGFDKLYQAYTEHSIKRINGIFLTNRLHSLISDAVLDMMNTAAGPIRYSHKTVDL